MLIPRKQKYRKMMRGRRKGISFRADRLAFGDFGLQSLGSAWVSSRQIESARRAMTRAIKREGQVWIRIFPDHPVTAQPAEVGMGGGKGSVDHFVAIVKPGRVMFEMAGVEPALAKKALSLARYKLSVKTRILEKIF